MSDLLGLPAGLPLRKSARSKPSYWKLRFQHANIFLFEDRTVYHFFDEARAAQFAELHGVEVDDSWAGKTSGKRIIMPPCTDTEQPDTIGSTNDEGMNR